ncbi:TetR/AcrR family transcriptional regulator [Actinokineospora sp. G85]|uniref:TetR/AcrR family transcriptional regulator n=1 Tax=Actinokineospora sp. G85 TaxID=3406626 RepID=UPI003C7359B8
MTTARTHRTQAQRREQTREALLEATIACLVELGYARTTVQEIAARAGVSRGAQQHHFTTKAELMTAALEHLFDRLIREVTSAADSGSDAALPTGRERVARGIDLLWRAYSGTLSTAAVELWVAARTDPELRASLRPVDRQLGHATLELYRRAVGGELPEAEVETLMLLSVNLVRGLALEAMMGGDPDRRTRLLDEWKARVLRDLDR